MAKEMTFSAVGALLLPPSLIITHSGFGSSKMAHSGTRRTQTASLGQFGQEKAKLFGRIRPAGPVGRFCPKWQLIFHWKDKE